MFAVLYEFKIKKDQNSVFEKAWSEWTKAIYRCRGSLGSRLHQSENPHKYIAYAQWPSRDVYESHETLLPYSKEELKYQGDLKEVCTSVTTQYLYEVIDDKLVDIVSEGR